MNTEQIIEEIKKAQGLMSFGYWDAANDLLEEVIQMVAELGEQTE
jgi:hypothetical protein